MLATVANLLVWWLSYLVLSSVSHISSGEYTTSFTGVVDWGATHSPLGTAMGGVCVDRNVYASGEYMREGVKL